MANDQDIPPLTEVNKWIRHYRGEIATFNQTLGEMGGATASRTPRATAGSKPNTTRQPRSTSAARAAAGRKGGRARAQKMGQGAAASGGSAT